MVNGRVKFLVVTFTPVETFSRTVYIFIATLMSLYYFTPSQVKRYCTITTVNPNSIIFEVILNFAYSFAKHLEKPVMACFDEEYSEIPISPLLALVDVKKINLP